jgi:hypothetical protein
MAISFYFPTYPKILNIIMIIALLISQIQIRNGDNLLSVVRRRHVFSESCSVDYKEKLLFLVTRVCVTLPLVLSEQMSSACPLQHPLQRLLRARVKYRIISSLSR